MIFELGNITLDIDIEKTKTYYESASLLTDDCSCDWCNNFAHGYKKLSNIILDFFIKLGVDISKPAEIIAFCSEDNGNSIYYGGFYHICGCMLTDTDCWATNFNFKGATCSSISESNCFSVTQDFSVGFTNSISLLEDDFPEPVIQMEIFIHNFPWVLDKPNKF